MSIDQELLEFARSRPVWQQDLMRRICTQPSISATDVDEVMAAIKASEGLGASQEPTPLAERHLSLRTATELATTKIAAISQVANANQLAAGQHLPFALTGLTLIYGDNGSGKTGYARIVKQLCRARRERQEPLLGNVYAKPAGPAKAQVTYLVGDKQCSFDWEDGKQVPPELSRISVFDASTAPLYADRQNAIEYLPLGLDVLPRLGKVCEALSLQIQTEVASVMRTIAVPLPQQIPGTTADDISKRLFFGTRPDRMPSVDEIEKAASWSPENEQELLTIEKELLLLSEPAQAAAQYRRFKTSVDTFIHRLDAVDMVLNAEAVTQYRLQFERADSAQAAAIIAAKDRFVADPLGADIGSAAWRRLFEIAEQFSAEIYPGEPFPVTGEGRVCLLCQQPYDGSAQDRMKRFQEFVEDASQREADREAGLLRDVVRRVTNVVLPTAEDLDVNFMELSDREPAFQPIKDRLLKYLEEAGGRRQAVLSALSRERSFDALGNLTSEALKTALDYAHSLEDNARALQDQAASTAAIDRLKGQHTELLGRRQLSASKATFVARLNDLLTVDKLTRCKEQCDTTQISRRNSDFRGKYLTPEFCDRIAEEIAFLGLGYLPVKVDAKTEKGTSYIGVALDKVAPARTSNILSEGEFRALALACFFAEVAMIPSHDGIVVDDPASSLDHRHVRQIARRLVQEAKSQPQVIVFTHDLSFYYELWMQAAEKRVPIQRNWVYRLKSKGFGVVAADDGPWQVKRVKERISYLGKILEGIPEESSVEPDEYGKKVNEFYARLREAWERLVEERLLNGVVGRFQPGVMTQSLKGVSVEDGDYQKVFFAMKKASEYSGHDWAQGREGSPPVKAEMQKDLEELRDYDKQLMKRADELDKRRRELEQPPRAEVVTLPLVEGLGRDAIAPDTKSLDYVPTRPGKNPDQKKRGAHPTEDDRVN